MVCVCVCVCVCRWVSSSEVRCTLPSITANNIIRGQVALLGERGPGSSSTIFSQTRRVMQPANIPAPMQVDIGYAPTNPAFSMQINSAPYTLRISMVGPHAQQ